MGREATGRVPAGEPFQSAKKAQGTERDEVRIKSAADGQAAEAAAGQSGFWRTYPQGAYPSDRSSDYGFCSYWLCLVGKADVVQYADGYGV